MTEVSSKQDGILVIDKTFARDGIAHALRSSGFSTIEFDPYNLEVNPLPKYQPHPSLAILGAFPQLPDIYRELESRGIPRAIIIDPFDKQKAAEYLIETSKLGTHGYLDIRSSPAGVTQAVNNFLKGEYFIPQSLQDILIHAVNHLYEANPYQFTKREAEVASLFGFSNNEIAERLRIREKTVKNHIGKVLLKSGMKTRTQAALLLEEEKLNR